MKILGSDYDGTLSVGGITGQKIKDIKRWREEGNRFGIVTGRSNDFLKYLRGKAPELEVDFYACCSGGYITDGDGKVIYETRCADVEIRKFIRELLALDCKRVYVYGKDNRCIVEQWEDMPKSFAKDKVFLLEDADDVEYFNQITVELPTPERATEIAGLLGGSYGERFNFLINGRSIDIVSAGVNKAQGLYRVMEYFGGTKDDIIAVGDNINDIDMIREFYSYAMESGAEALKEIADGVVSDVSEILGASLPICHKI